MAAKAEVLTGTATAPRTTRHQGRPSTARRIVAGFATWARKGQLGSSQYTELGRHTGGRI